MEVTRMGGQGGRMVAIDPWLAPYAAAIDGRVSRYRLAADALRGNAARLADMANGHLYYGVHPMEGGWVCREKAPGVDAMHLIGDFNGWDRASHPMRPVGNGDWEIELAGEGALTEGGRLLLQLTRGGQTFDRVPAYIRQARQDPATRQYHGIVPPRAPYQWRHAGRRTPPRPLYIYEAHVGMAQEQPGVGSFRAFAERVLPRVKKAGYNAIQLMAIQEHAYYASFGYQVTGFFAASSWYGDPDDLKALIDAAHGMGLYVLLDLVHSHAADNARDGIADFDGSGRLYCAGDHPAWGSKLLSYSRPETLHFLLSNVKFWLEEYRFDGFRFDGVTSMLYRDHGLGRSFTGYADYFGDNVDRAALTYLQLATQVAREVNPAAVLIAEDMSGMPGTCLPASWGGLGFHYRLQMGEPDFWIKAVKDRRDEDWDMHEMWYQLTTRRPREKVIGYAESHDQALVGDKALIFRMMDAEMYAGMDKSYRSPTVDRAIALIKLIKLITLTLGGDGYLNFMGNEFGHPEWIDFPREGNGWGYHYARRQWSLADNDFLKYGQLAAFDRAMLALGKRLRRDHGGAPQGLWIDQERKTIAFAAGRYALAFNFHPTQSYQRFAFAGLNGGDYRVCFDSDRPEFGGDGRISQDEIYRAGGGAFAIYLPSRTALVVKRQ
ncbi:MAG: 1,4-alpha-glucan-branching enzyme [Clostridiales bacterium]|nr:1,4-alpha-glucan-branching enzyme [Clostridiales bacterium]